MAISTTLNREQRRARGSRGGPALRPAASSPDAVFAAALRNHQAGRLTEAEALYRQVLAIDRRHADSLHLLGVVAHQQERPDLAVTLIGKAIAIRANEASYHSNLGNALWKQGRLAAAETSYRRALKLKSDYPKAHFNLGTVLWKQRRLDEAEVCYRDAIVLQPNYPEAYDNLGGVLKDLGRLDDAMECYRAAIQVRPNYPDAHNNLGTALLAHGRPDEAIACYIAALKLRPDYPEAHYNLGIVSSERGQPATAAAHYRAALALRPDYADAHLNLGVALKELGQLDEAVTHYRAAIAIEPDHPEAHSNLGIALLAQGDLTEGWGEHEWRWRTPRMIDAVRGFSRPQWRGEAAAGKTLLIHAEQGFGDTLQFCRYARLAKERGSRVVLEVQKPLVRLLRGLEGADLVIGRGEPPPPFDLHCPMLSLPLALNTTLATIPGAMSYLNADPAQAARWRARLAAMRHEGPRIGLVWAGSRRDHSRDLAAVDKRRSIAPDRLAPLLDLSAAQFFSLQKDGPPAPADFPMIDVMDEMDDFADTAALIVNLDLVIAVDTAVAHLAAALGKPVWLLDRFDGCWRWLTNRADSPWYPGVRLYRQPRPGDWDSVLARVTCDLRKLVAVFTVATL